MVAYYRQVAHIARGWRESYQFVHDIGDSYPWGWYSR